MPFVKLNEQAKPGVYQPNLFEDAERKQIQHQIANYVKQLAKEHLDKGPEAMRVTIADDMVVIKSERYLSRMEQFIIRNASGVDTVKLARQDAIDRVLKETDILEFLEGITNAKPLYTLFDSYPLDDYCIWIFMFDRKLV